MPKNLPSLNHSLLAQERRAGVCLPVWSLLSDKSFECGDLYSLEAIIPWLKNTGLSILQILPLNDCGYGSSPYSSLSSFAIDPMYISLYKLGIKQFSRKKNIATQFINKQRITEIKIEYLSDFYQANISKHNVEIDEFLKNQDWLKAYLVFKFYYLKYKGLHWEEWTKKEKIKVYSDDIFTKLMEDPNTKSEIYFQAWLQLVAYTQLKEIKKIYTHNKLLLKGDMPILTSSNSADVWKDSFFYRIDLQAGAPPDAFSAVGQNWGFPVLDWAKMADADYRPWRERLSYQENFFHLFRVDHAIGLYRIWSIPKSAKSAKFGYFYPQKGVSIDDFKSENMDPILARERGIVSPMDDTRYYFHWDFNQESGFHLYSDIEKEKLYKLSFQNLTVDEKYWKEAGEKVLKVFQDATTMFPCMEDLGSVPGFVRDSLYENKLFGIDVIRWTRSFEDGSFIAPDHYRNNAISTLSTHDTSLVLDWWFKELNPHERDYAESVFLSKDIEKANSTLDNNNPEYVLRSLLDFAFSTNSQFSIQMLSDLIFCGKYSVQEDWHLHKINVPGTIEEKNWKYRFNFTAEDLIHDKELTKGINQLLLKSKRIVN
ncbi:MAG: 4-alpha-glucanotransferase [Leptospira sp.]|nr:4-alpha-glucanotransferase [Leptospira sp.]